jgi:hypothetical protein
MLNVSFEASVRINGSNADRSQVQIAVAGVKALSTLHRPPLHGYVPGSLGML